MTTSSHFFISKQQKTPPSFTKRRNRSLSQSKLTQSRRFNDTNILYSSPSPPSLPENNTIIYIYKTNSNPVERLKSKVPLQRQIATAAPTNTRYNPRKSLHRCALASHTLRSRRVSANDN